MRNHPDLQGLIESGALDFARYDAGEDSEIRLIHSGEVLSPQTLRNPLVVLANYDGIPQDAFSVHDGKLFECLVTLAVPEGETDLEDPGLLERVEVSWEERPAPALYWTTSRRGLCATKPPRRSRRSGARRRSRRQGTNGLR